MELRKYIEFILVVAFVNVSSSLKVKVAVYEHVVISAADPERNFTRQEAFSWMSKNLAVFEVKSREAAEQGAKIIVFPEYGVTGFDQTRDSMIPFLENIPSGSEEWNPCLDPAKHRDTLVLRNLSCIARTNKIYIVANMGDIKQCDRKMDALCPLDGRYQFNTNVVFDDRGTLVARYHKRHMYDETPLFDPAPTSEYIYFETPYGRFGTIVCFDIMHYDPTQVLINKYEVRNVLVTSAWNVFYPFVLSVQMYAGLAKRDNVNVIAANIRNSDYNMAGSGIFGDGVEVSSDTNYNASTGVLLISEIETSSSRTTLQERVISPVREDVESVHDIVDTALTHFGIYDYGMNMSYIVLAGDNGTQAVCHKDVCCIAYYNFQHRSSELFILSAVDFNLFFPGNIHMQFCAVHKCLTEDLSTCGDYVTVAETTVSDIKIQGFFDNGVVFPFVSTSQFDNGTLNMEMDHYLFDKDKAILESHRFEHPLLAAVVYSSVYTGEKFAPATGSSNAIHSVSYIFLIVPFLLISLSFCQRDS